MAFIHLLNVYGKSRVKLLFLSEHCYLHFHLRAWESWQLLPHPNSRKVILGIILFLSWVHKVTNTIAPTPHPTNIYFSFQNTFVVLLHRPACAVTFKAKRRGDRGLKAINNQMLSEPHWRKRMQLYEQDPGLRQTTVCFRSLWGLAWKGESGGVAWQTSLSVYFSLPFYPWSKKQTTQTSPFFSQENTSYLLNPTRTHIHIETRKHTCAFNYNHYRLPW